MQDLTTKPSPPTILIVDDTPFNLQLLVGMLKQYGYQIRAALSGQLALQAVREAPPDLILLDINMPDISGFEVCRILKESAEYRDIPIIFVSALHDTEDKVRAFAAGGEDYITKPFRIEEVVARVQAHMELLRKRRELQERYAELKGLEEMRDGLVHMIVHDLRNPLWSIHGYLDMMRELEPTALSPVAREYLDQALANTGTLVEMLNSILDVSRMEAGALTLEPEACRLEEVVQGVIREAMPLMRSRAVVLDSKTTKTVVRADRKLLVRVMENLLANAMRYTSEKSGAIGFRIVPGERSVRVEVRDNGQVIPPDRREAIFQKYNAVQSVVEGRRHSSGLGLPFCKLAVEAHGGRIGVEGETGQGNVFWIELPLVGPSEVKGAGARVGGGRV